MLKTHNSLAFTIDHLDALQTFIESDMVKEKQWFCGYDIQALEDARVYLEELYKIKEIVNEIK